MKWQIALEKSLRKYQASRVLTPPMLKREVLMVAGKLPSVAGLTRWLKESVETDRLVRVRQGLYLNKMTLPAVTLDEAAGHLLAGAVPSLQYVTGQYGINHNYTDIITAVVPLMSGLPNPKLGLVTLPGGRFHFRGLPLEIMKAGREEDRLDNSRPWIKSATPEKALADWVYLGNSPRSNLTMPPQDIEIKDIDQRRFKRLVKAMKIESIADVWWQKTAAYQATEDAQTKTSSALGW